MGVTREILVGGQIQLFRFNMRGAAMDNLLRKAVDILRGFGE